MLFTLYSIYIGKVYGMCVSCAVLYYSTMGRLFFFFFFFLFNLRLFVRLTQMNNLVRQARQEAKQNRAQLFGLCSPMSIDDCYHANMIHGLSTLSTTLYKFPVYMHGMLSICSWCSSFALAKTKKETQKPSSTKAMCDGAQWTPCSHSQTHTHTHYMHGTGKMCKSENAKKLNSKFSGRPI